MYTRIVVPLDVSELAALALAEAMTIAWRTAAPLHLVRVIALASLSHGGGYAWGSGALARHLIGDEVAEATADLAQTAARLQVQGLTVTTEVRQGDVVDELLRVAQPGDLYGLATHGRSGVTRWLLGSVAEALVRRSVIPVLIVRALVPSRVSVRMPAAVPVSAAQPASA
jgi:nucleotide-binding universal stress UspA family protein